MASQLKPPHIFSLIIIIAAILLRVYQIGYNFECDEIVSAQVASGTFSHMVGAHMRQDLPSPPLYNILLFFWGKFFGNSEISVRIPSVLLSFLFLFIVYRLALLLMSAWSALFVLSVCSFSHFFIYYGQQARPYSLLSFFTALSLYLVLNYQKRPSFIKEICYFLTCAAALYTSYLSVFFLIPQFIYLQISDTLENRRLKRYGIAGALSILPLVLCLLRFTQPLKLKFYISWIPKPNFLSFIGLYSGDIFGWVYIHGSRIWEGLFCIVMVSGPLIFNWQKLDRKNVILLMAIALFNPVISFIFSIYGPYSVWAPRHLMGSMLSFILLLGIALSSLRKRLRIIFMLVLISMCVVYIPYGFPENTRPPWRYVAGLISKKHLSQYVIAQSPYTGMPLQFYLRENVPCSNHKALKTEKKAVFVCSDGACDRLEDIKLNYKVVEQRVVKWGIHNRKITIFFLENN